MSTRKGRPAGNQGRRPWQPMGKATRIIPQDLADLAATEPDVAAVIDDAREIWMNDRYIVHVDRREDGTVTSLSIRRADRSAARDWRDFQQIKNEIAGPDVEAFELYPARDRTMDTANQYWLWCLPPGKVIEAGFRGRVVTEPGEDPRFTSSKQRDFLEGQDI
jgi:hypothetical protein